MADTKISALTQLAEAPADADELVLVDKSDTTQAASGSTKRITAANLRAGLVDNPALSTVVFNAASGRDFEDLRGDALGYTANSPGLLADLRIGTAADPITGPSEVGGVFKISKTEDLRVADYQSGQSNDQSANLVLISHNLATSEVQSCPAYLVAESRSTSVTAGANRDAMGLGATGRIVGSGTGRGIGVYASGRRDTDTGNANGLEVRCWNETLTEGTYNPTGASDTMGVWMSAGGQEDSGVGIAFGGVNQRQWINGIAFGKYGSPSISAVRDNSIRDDGEAVNSIKIGGTHSKGILIDGTNTEHAIAVAAGAGPVQIGRTLGLINASALLEVYSNVGAGSSLNPMAAFVEQQATKNAIVKVSNSSGSLNVWVAGAADQMVLGTVAGDLGISFSNDQAFHIGRSATTAPLVITDGIGFFGVTPVTQRAAIASPTTQGASLKTAVDAIRQVLIDLGLTAA